MGQVQLFRDTEYNQRFDAWTARNKSFQAAHLLRMFDQLPTSKTFGEFIWDNNLSDLAEFFTRDFFADNWTAIVGALQIAGTYEAYLTIIRSALGEGTVISFDAPSPSHLIINIVNPTGEVTRQAYTENVFVDRIPDQTQYPDTVRQAQTSIAPLTIKQTEKLIQLLNVNGVYVVVNFVSSLGEG